MLPFDVEVITPLDFPDDIVDTVIGNVSDKNEPVRVAEKGAAVVDTKLIEDAANKTVELFKDGFQVSDIFPALSNLMEMAEVVQGASSEEKKELVVQGAKMVYEKLDPDISSWVPQWIEKKIVNWALEAVVPHAVNWAISITKGKLAVNKESTNATGE